jgi:hypothetical protein
MRGESKRGETKKPGGVAKRSERERTNGFRKSTAGVSSLEEVDMPGEVYIFTGQSRAFRLILRSAGFGQQILFLPQLKFPKLSPQQRSDLSGTFSTRASALVLPD